MQAWECRGQGGKWIPAHYNKDGTFMPSYCKFGDTAFLSSSDEDRNYIEGKRVIQERQHLRLLRQQINIEKLKMRREQQKERKEEFNTLHCGEGEIPIVGYNNKNGIHVRAHCRKPNELSRAERKIVKTMQKRGIR